MPSYEAPSYPAPSYAGPTYQAPMYLPPITINVGPIYLPSPGSGFQAPHASGGCSQEVSGGPDHHP